MWVISRHAQHAELTYAHTYTRADERLDDIEREPPPAARAAWAAVSKAGELAAHPSVRSAARLTASLSADFVRAAVPVGASLGQGALKLAWQARGGLAQQNCLNVSG